MVHPYEDLPETAYWNRAVAGCGVRELRGLYQKKFDIGFDTRIATAGSCFAQHIKRRLAAVGVDIVDKEPAPPVLPKADWGKFGFGLFSARFGNIYTARQLLQLLLRATGQFEPQEWYWEDACGFVDPFRPSVQPLGFDSIDELRHALECHLRAVIEVFREADVFVFTLGLTEFWMSKTDGAVYQTCPGTVAGTFDASKYVFRNSTCREIVDDMKAFFVLARTINERLRFMLTVSPVSLVATAAGKHVLVANTYSKSALRAAAGQLADELDFVVYYPSYEVIATPVSRGALYLENFRGVSQAGVELATQAFVDAHFSQRKAAEVPRRNRTNGIVDEIEEVCDELAYSARDR